MLLAKDLMTKDVITLSPDTEVGQAAKLLLDKGINGAPVVDSTGKVVGILCQSDLVAQQRSLPLPSFFILLDGFIPLTSSKRLEKEVAKIAATTVGQAMTPDPVTVTPDTPSGELAALMVEKKYHTLPVVEDGRLAGVLGKEDLLKILMS